MEGESCIDLRLTSRRSLAKPPMCYLWEMVETSFQLIIFLQSQGEGPKMYLNVMHPGSQSVTYVYHRTGTVIQVSCNVLSFKVFLS